MSKITKWAHKINNKTNKDVINTIVHGNHVRVFCWVEGADGTPYINYGDAFCHKKHDNFDINVGRAIAIARAFDIDLPRFVTKGK